MNAVIAVFNSLSVRGRSRYTADFAATHRSECTTTFLTHCIMCTFQTFVEEMNSNSNVKAYFTDKTVKEWTKLFFFSFNFLNISDTIQQKKETLYDFVDLFQKS
jgi:hypothetical protein